MRMVDEVVVVVLRLLGRVGENLLGPPQHSAQALS
jgi:hypothetical protein